MRTSEWALSATAVPSTLASTSWPRPLRPRSIRAAMIPVHASSGRAVSLMGIGEERGASPSAARLGRHEARQRLGEDVVARPPAARPVGAEGRDRAVDQPGVELARHLPAEAQALGDARPHVRDEHVGAGDQVAHHGLGLGAAEVEAHGALVAVGLGVVAAAPGPAGDALVVAPLVARGPLHLDHVRAQVAQVHGGQRAGEVVRDVQHAQAGERGSAHGADAILGPRSRRRKGAAAMGLMGRFTTIVKAKANKALDRAEDPARDARLLLREAARDAAEGAPRRGRRGHQQEAPRAPGGEARAERREARRPGAPGAAAEPRGPGARRPRAQEGRPAPAPVASTSSASSSRPSRTSSSSPSSA